ncbi:MAG: Holliday junction resolvase RuvX [Actinobacteria bacterium]|nr:Holliday junction resolvase RuvX [Actinomycetota bacterium]
MAEAGRVLGLDPGDVRIGVAISDAGRRIAVPLGTVRVGRPPGELKAIAEIASENGVVLVVVGHPLSLSGEAGARARQAESFADALRASVGIPVELQDERMSTVEAERALRAAGARGRDVRRAVDRSSAALILQAWLDEHQRA